jgi:hypothetical protein
MTKVTVASTSASESDSNEGLLVVGYELASNQPTTINQQQAKNKG